MKPGEFFEIEVVADKGSTKDRPELRATERSLINGEIRLQVDTGRELNSRQNRPSWIHPVVWNVAKTLATLFTLGASMIGFVAPVMVWQEFIQAARWKKTWGPVAERAIWELHAKQVQEEAKNRIHPKSEIEALRSRPSALSSAVLQEFADAGISEPVTSLFGSVLGAIAFTLLALTLAIALWSMGLVLYVL